ncbi:MAG: hypothetical protein N2254_08955 [bacterium]|nr:hypothetical protein [bacterium]
MLNRKISYALTIAIIFIIACSSNKNGKTQNSGNNPPPATPPCDSSVVFFPEEISGDSPLQVTYSATFKGVNSEGITSVMIDFGADNFIDDIYSYELTPQNSFSYNAIYSSVGDFRDAFYFLWSESEGGKIKNCSVKKESKIRVTFLCPQPSIEVIAQVIDSTSKSANILVRPTNMSLQQVTFYAGYETPQKINCIPDNRFQNSCLISASAPDFGDWSLCWYAESFCGKKTEQSCLSFIISYPFTEVLNYGVGKIINFSSLEDKIAAITPPYISVISKDGDVIKRIGGAAGDIRWLKSTSEGIWILKITDKFNIVFIDFSGNITENVVNPNSIFGTIGFDIYKTTNKRYAIVLRSFQENGDIVVFDITSFDASTPICRKIIPAGPRIIEFINGYAFVGYINEVHSYKIDFLVDICEVKEPEKYNLTYTPSLFDIEGDFSKAIAAYSSDFSSVKGKIFAFGFDFSSGKFYDIGSANASVGSNIDILSLKVSPFDLSYVAVSYLNKDIGEYRTKIHDFSANQSIGGVEGLKISDRAVFSSFLGKTTVAVIDEKNTINILEFPASKKTKKIGGFRNTNIKTSQIIETDCNAGKTFMTFPDGGGIVTADISSVFSPSGGFPVISTYISKDAVSVQKGPDNKTYAIFNTGNSLFLSDTDFSFSVTVGSSDITGFSAGSTYFITGGSSGIFYAKKNFSSFLNLNFSEIYQLKKTIYISPFFFLFSGNSLLILKDDLEKVLNVSFGCQDIAVSDDKTKIYCMNAFGVSEHRFENNSIIQSSSRSFILPVGDIYDSDFEDGHIFFLSDLGISKGFGIIRASDMKVVVLLKLPDDVEPISISAKKYCLPNLVFVSAYGNFPDGTIVKGWLVKTK